MNNENQEKITLKPQALKSNTQKIAFCALFIALSIVLGKYASITAGAFRISFENLPILMAAVMLGPIYGAVVGACADLVGCLLVGYSINPIITVGAAIIGATCGLVYKFLPVAKQWLKLLFAVGAAHILGSMIVKSIGLMVYYGYPLNLVLLRIPLYIFIGGLEFAFLLALQKRGLLDKMNQ